MADDADFVRTRLADGRLPAASPAPRLRPEDYREGFAEDLTHTLDLGTWSAGRNLDEEYRRIEREVNEAVGFETELQRRVRDEIHPRLAWGPTAPKGAGRHKVPFADLTDIHRRLLFNGGVEGCDGTCAVHDTLALTIHQIGVALVSYNGDQNTWSHRLFRRDLRLHDSEPFADVYDLLERRTRRGGGLHESPRDLLSELARRALMSYGERAALARKSRAIWRIGHGSPAPYELLTGGGYADLVIESIKVFRELIEGHQKFVFVSSEPSSRALLTIGQGLKPLEYCVIGTLQERIAEFLHEWHGQGPVTVDARWEGQALSAEQWVMRFRDEVAPKVVYGLYRATRLSAPQLFYAHEDHSEVAARVALADSVLDEVRGFPLLIDMADQVCRSVYGGGSLREMAQTAYAAANAPWRYQSERALRDQ